MNERARLSGSAMSGSEKLLGGLPFVSRTFEGGFKDNPYVLDMDANLYIGPADHISRDEHSAIEIIYHFLKQTGRVSLSLREMFRNRLLLLEAFEAFDHARRDDGPEEFRLVLFGTYDGEALRAGRDDDLPAGPCGRSVNELKRRLYGVCARADRDFSARTLSPGQQRTEARFEEHRRALDEGVRRP